MKTIAYIPARLDSTRFPQKILKTLHGKTLLEWAWLHAIQSDLFDEVIVLGDDSRVVEHAKSFGAKGILTSKKPQNGTQRIIEALDHGAPIADKIVNVQADEPMLNKKIFETLLSGDGRGLRIWTLKKQIQNIEEVQSKNVVKVVCDHNGEALYFSRSPIPYDRDGTAGPYYKHIGLYAYTPESLNKIATLQRCHLEQMESLEQLTPLYHGIRIQVHETDQVVHGVDTLEDLIHVEKIFQF